MEGEGEGECDRRVKLGLGRILTLPRRRRLQMQMQMQIAFVIQNSGNPEMNAVKPFPTLLQTVSLSDIHIKFK